MREATQTDTISSGGDSGDRGSDHGGGSHGEEHDDTLTVYCSSENMYLGDASFAIWLLTDSVAVECRRDSVDQNVLLLGVLVIGNVDHGDIQGGVHRLIFDIITVDTVLCHHLHGAGEGSIPFRGSLLVVSKCEKFSDTIDDSVAHDTKYTRR